MSDIRMTTIPMLRNQLIKTAEALQRLERRAAAIIPYPGGIIAFGSREAVRQMVEGDGDE